MKYEIIKGSEKDFIGAPEWATMAVVFNGAGGHGIDFSDGMTEGVRVFYGHSKKEAEIPFPPHWRIIAERRPITEPVVNQQLTTEWLPEVGERIEYACIKFDENRPAIEFGKWYGGTVIAYHEGAVWTSDNGIRLLRNTKFRPMKSPEDVARDETIEAIKNKLLVRREVAESFYYFIANGNIPTLRIKNN